MVIKMHRELITIGPITIYWYSLIIITAIVIGIYFSSKKAEKNGLGKDFLLDLIFYLIPAVIPAIPEPNITTLCSSI
jgi:phosphatidylglycerol---prolipoprotein diacylglyceryl transferase